MRTLSKSAILLLLAIGLAACSSSSGNPAAATSNKAPDSGQITRLIQQANKCRPDDFACKQLEALKQALKKLEAFGFADLQAYMQTASLPAVKTELITAFMTHLSPEMLPVLTPEMNSTDWGLRRAAQQAAAAIGTDQAIDALINLLDEADDAIPELVPTLLAKKPEHPKVKEAVPRLKKLGEGAKNNATKANAVEAVAKIVGHDAVPWLIKIALHAEIVSSRTAAVQALEPWADETPVYNCLVDVSKNKKEIELARLAKKIAIEANKR